MQSVDSGIVFYLSESQWLFVLENDGTDSLN